METNSRLGQIAMFGPFEVNLLTGELRKHGIRLSLQEQPRRILGALIERGGDVVTREDLCRRLWPHGTFVDFEHSLNAAVRRLRVTLGDDAATPRFIETVPRRGYRFLVWDFSKAGPKPGPTSTVRAMPDVRLPGPTSTNDGPTFSNVRLAFRPATRVRLAVRPFVLLARESADLFSDGLTEETITQLARTCPPHVAVLARTSAMRLSGRDHGAAEAGRLLSADYLLEGSIRRDGDHLRIVAQLIETQEETHVWAATFDRVLEAALTLQTEVAEQIARAVANALADTTTAVGF